MTDAEIEGYLAEEEAAFARFAALMDRIPDERFEESTVLEEGWSPKDLVFHVAAWLDEAAASIEEDRPWPYEGEESDRETDRVNAEFLARSHAMDAGEVREALIRGRARFLTALSGLETLTEAARDWVDDVDREHYDEHGEQLRSWLEA